MVGLRCNKEERVMPYRDKAVIKRDPEARLMCQQCRNKFMGMCKVFPLGVMDKFLKMKEEYING